MSNVHPRTPNAIVACVLAAMAACGPRVGDGGGSAANGDQGDASSTSTSGSNDTATNGSTTSTEPLVCAKGETPCGSECVDLLWSEEHCGACDRACRTVGGVGECWQGDCPPTIYCAMANEGLETCAEVCAAYGQACIDAEPTVPGSCGGKFYGLFHEVSPSFDCEVGFVASSLMMGGCTDLIRWDHIAGPNGGSLPDAVSCCCTQP